MVDDLYEADHAPANASIQLRAVTSGHMTKMAVTSFDPTYQKPRAARRRHGAVYYRTGVITDRNFTLREYRDLDHFCFRDPDLDPMTFVYE